MDTECLTVLMMSALVCYLILADILLIQHILNGRVSIKMIWKVVQITENNKETMETNTGSKGEGHYDREKALGRYD